MQTKVGIEVEVESEYLSYYSASTEHDLWCPDWVLERDGSLRGEGFEIKSNGPQRLDTIRGKLCQLYPLLHHSSGTWRAAVHVHVDARATTWHQRAVILAMGYVYDMALFKRYAPERVESNFCVPLEHKTPGVFSCIRDMLESRQLHNYGKYSSINVLPLQTLGTVEFRHMRTPETEGDVHSVASALGMISSYTLDCAALVKAAEQAADYESKPAEALLRAIETYENGGGGMKPNADALGEVLAVLADMPSYDSVLLDVASVARVVEPASVYHNELEEMEAELASDEYEWEDE